MDKRFGLKTNCIADIVNVLKLQPEVEEAIIFGSRAMGTFKNGSDIDIALKGEKITFDTISTIRLRLDELPYLYMYDIVDYKKVSNPAVTTHIDELGITFYKKEGKPSEWKTYKLGELVEINKNSINKNYSFSEIEYLDTSSVTQNRFSELQKLNLSEAPSRAKRVVKENDIIYSTVRPILRHYGIAKNINANTVASTGFAVLTAKKIDPNFLYYYLTTDEIVYFLNSVAEANTTTFPAFNASLFENIEVTIPESLETQTQIAQILSSLDDKIELNHEMNQTLEAMAQALFKEWFVNFSFPNFDGELENGLPKGWRMGSVLEIAILLSGGTPKTDTEEYWNGSINWISAKDITSSNNQFIIETEKTITELGIKKSAAKLLPKFTTIISARGTVGNYCILSKEMAISQSNYGLKSNSNNDYFLFLMVENMILMMKAFSYGTVFDTITTKTFQEMEIIIPDEKVIKDFEKVVTPLYEKILTNQFQIQSLTQTRDTLLPKLMSGSLQVKSDKLKVKSEK